MAHLDRPGAPAPGHPSLPRATGNARPLLHEILHALRRLLEGGSPTAIDLLSIPMGPDDEQELFAVLGAGELTAHLDALGRSEIRETGVHGVWVVEHLNADGQLVGKFIEVTFLPDILRSQVADVRHAVVDLEGRLSGA
jgi:hydrogenase-1 operon protein HyaF